jgi:hypothetical protein
MTRKFPIFWTVVLIFALAWLLDEMNIISIKLPFGPAILVVIAIGMIWNRLRN